ncbi:MAG: SsrA-binding protein SmpB [Bdellovibrionales bacterium]
MAKPHKPAAKSESGGIKIVTENRKARHDYMIMDKHEAGMVLTGSEVKSLRAGQCQLKDSYVVFQNGEMYLQNAHISEYKASSYNNHTPERKRKLLMHVQEIRKLDSKTQEKGLTLIPLKVYFKNGRAKVEIALAKGKKAHDKRESIKSRDVDRQLQQERRR